MMEHASASSAEPQAGCARAAGRSASGSTRTPSLLGAWGLPDTPGRAGPVLRRRWSRRWPIGSPYSSRNRHFSSVSVRRNRRTGVDNPTVPRDAGALVLLDVKRGDIGSTAAAYAERVPRSGESAVRRCDHRRARTSGFGSLRPFLDWRATHGGGVFVLAADLEPGGRAGAAGAHGGRTNRRAARDRRDFRRSTQVPSRSGRSGVVIGATSARPGIDRDEHQWPDARARPRRAGRHRRRTCGRSSRGVCGLRAAVVLAGGPRRGPDRRGRCATAAERSLDECRNVLNYPILRIATRRHAVRVDALALPNAAADH